MRNAFVVLVSLCIGLTSGLIVPSGGLELMGENRALLADNSGKESEESKRVGVQDEANNGFIVLPFRTINKNKIDLETNNNRIKDKEIYDQHPTKQNNVNERSFIYINQKYKTPVVNQLYSAPDLKKHSYKSVISLQNKEDTHFKYPSFQKPNKKLFESVAKPTLATKVLYFPPVHKNDAHKPIVDSENKKVEFKINQQNNNVETQHEYVELLKPPLLRPHITVKDKEETALKWTFPEPKINGKHRLNNNIFVPATNAPANENKLYVNHYENYGFPTPYGYERSIPKYNYNDLLDSSIKKIIIENNNVDVSSLLDRYLKNTLEEQVTNERINAKNANNCTYSDCILKSRKQYIHSRVKSGPECKCSGKLNVKRIRNEKRVRNEESNSFEHRETTQKAETLDTNLSTEVHVTTRSSESNDYSEMLNEEMNLKKLMED